MKVVTGALLLLSAVSLRAEIKTQEKSQVQFPGMLGRMMNIFGGKAMREGVVDTVAVKGNRKITLNDTTGQIIDLDEEKIYNLDMRSKTYQVRTFDDVRRQMEQAQEQARQAQQKQQPASEPKSATPPPSDAKQMQIDFDLKQTGQTRNINGYDCREVVMTITVHEKGKTLEQSGGMVMTTHEWLTKKIDAMKEIADFDRRYAEKLHGPTFAAMPSADQMAAAAAMYPMLTEALGKFNVENVNMDGTPILTTMVTESVASAEQIQQQQQQQQQQNAQSNDSGGIPTSVGGLIGGLGRRAIRNRAQKQQQQQQENSAPGRATVMTLNNEVIQIATQVSASDLAIPAGFQQKN
ncbi:MAG TPA: hypothetical protein VKX39_05590 [Bryobacteraceae bacterium]|jgi:hypothetical protein|nr:hypothetical protein [Bryobacteraceae bacterium]